jgi:hypothetical protein
LSVLVQLVWCAGTGQPLVWGCPTYFRSARHIVQLTGTLSFFPKRS